MGEALLIGASSGGGIRNKKITKSGYSSLSDADKNNPYIIWIITDDDGTNFTSKDGSELVVKAIHYETYCLLDDIDKNNPTVLWVIVDLHEGDYSKLNLDTTSGSRFYNVGGVSTAPERLKGVDYKLNRESRNPISNSVVANKIEEIESRLGGLSFGVTETGGLRIEYDDGLTYGGE